MEWKSVGMMTFSQKSHIWTVIKFHGSKPPSSSHWMAFWLLKDGVLTPPISSHVLVKTDINESFHPLNPWTPAPRRSCNFSRSCCDSILSLWRSLHDVSKICSSNASKAIVNSKPSPILHNSTINGWYNWYTPSKYRWSIVALLCYTIGNLWSFTPISVLTAALSWYRISLFVGICHHGSNKLLLKKVLLLLSLV